MPNKVLKASTELASIAAWESLFQTTTLWEKKMFSNVGSCMMFTDL